ncbi:MAG: hypothetical protein JXQ72_00145 [Anaerolineae bacterium]|nr:hypothetical protein [Anaerolineae bacterium]
MNKTDIQAHLPELLSKIGEVNDSNKAIHLCTGYPRLTEGLIALGTDGIALLTDFLPPVDAPLADDLPVRGALILLRNLFLVDALDAVRPYLEHPNAHVQEQAQITVAALEAHRMIESETEPVVARVQQMVKALDTPLPVSVETVKLVEGALTGMGGDITPLLVEAYARAGEKGKNRLIYLIPKICDDRALPWLEDSFDGAGIAQHSLLQALKRLLPPEEAAPWEARYDAAKQVRDANQQAQNAEHQAKISVKNPAARVQSMVRRLSVDHGKERSTAYNELQMLEPDLRPLGVAAILDYLNSPDVVAANPSGLGGLARSLTGRKQTIPYLDKTISGLIALDAYDELAGLKDHPNRDVRQIADQLAKLYAPGRLTPTDPILRARIESLANNLTAPDGIARLEAGNDLIAMGETVVPTLIAHLQDPTIPRRYEILPVLYRFRGEPEAMRALVAAQSDADRAVAQKAKELLTGSR